MTDIPTYHRGDRNFGTGYDMMKQIEALEDEIERITKIASAAIDAVHEVQTYEQPDDPWAENALVMGELDAFEFDVAASRAALTQEGK